MSPTDYVYMYSLALAQFNLMQIKQENEMLKATAGMTTPMPAYNFLPPSRIENTGPCCKFSDCFEPIKPPEDDDYKKGYLDGWLACADYFINKELNNKEEYGSARHGEDT